MKTYTFIKTNGEWYIDLPSYVQAGGNPEDLQMVAGADLMLDLYSENTRKVNLLLDTKAFKSAEVIRLKQVAAQTEGGGAFYEMALYQGRPIHQVIWLCDVLLFVFGTIPESIYIKKDTSESAIP